MAEGTEDAQTSEEAPPAHGLKVWLGSVKLDSLYPTRQALEQLLYGSPGCSADDADVIALFLMDLLLTNDSVDSYRHLLQKALRNPEDYVINERDPNLLIRFIPAQLVKSSESGGRYVSMSVAVHRRNVPAVHGLGSCEETFAVFPAPVMLTCKSPRKNVQEPSFKGILAQFVVLGRADRELDLLLLGANLDTQHEPKQAQLEALERFVQIRKRGAPFCALMWGDFNNRLIAFEELAEFMGESRGKYHLQDAGVDFLVDMLSDPTRRRELLQKDDLAYAGSDVAGRLCAPGHCGEKMRELFTMHIDAKHLEVPLPSYKRTPMDHHLSELLGCHLRLEDLVVADQLLTQSATLENLFDNPLDRYFGWDHEGEYLQREIKSEAAPEAGSSASLYLQLGWPDGVGIFRGSSMPAELLTWEAEGAILAQDHLPLRSVVSVKWEGGRDLKVWLGFAKLAFKAPTKEVLQQLLYGSPTSSAEDADVIALFLTDLLLTNENVDSRRRMLQRALQSQHDYIVNEEDPNLPIRHVPAQLVKPGERGGRYVSMSVAVHRRNVEDCNADGVTDSFDCFLFPVQLSCKSPRKNELEPSFKAVMLQEVLLSRSGQQMDLLLLGANLDTQHGARLSQVEAVHRLLKARKSANPFCAIVWGDLNHRLVAYEDLRPHVQKRKSHEFELTDSGTKLLADMIADPAGRRELLLKDSMIYTGADIEGRQCEVSKSSELIRHMFSLHIDAALEGRIEVPLPFYKHTPPEVLLAKRLGCRLRLEDVALLGQLRGATLEEGHWDLKRHYFGWRVGGKTLQRTAKADVSVVGREATYLQLGWLDGIGIYRGGTAPASLQAWETEEQVLAFDHLPLRAMVDVLL